MNHAKKLEKMMTAAGFAARAVYGGNRHNEEIIGQYGEKKIQFLLSCQLISEGGSACMSLRQRCGRSIFLPSKRSAGESGRAVF